MLAGAIPQVMVLGWGLVPRINAACFKLSFYNLN